MVTLRVNLIPGFREKYPAIKEIKIFIDDSVIIPTLREKERTLEVTVHLDNWPEEKALPHVEIDELLSITLSGFIGAGVDLAGYSEYIVNIYDRPTESRWRITIPTYSELVDVLNIKVNPRRVVDNKGQTIPLWWNHFHLSHLINWAERKENRDWTEYILPEFLLRYMKFEKSKGAGTKFIRRDYAYGLAAQQEFLLPEEATIVRAIPVIDQYYPKVLTDMIVSYL